MLLSNNLKTDIKLNVYLKLENLLSFIVTFKTW